MACYQPDNRYEYLIALGSNLSPRQKHLESAIELLGNIGEVCSVSSTYQTSPIGPADKAFLNSALILKYSGAPQSLLESLHKIESLLGRKRGIVWGNRTIDLDIIAARVKEQYIEISTQSLTIPHAHACERDFVLVPAVEIADDWEIDATPLVIHLKRCHMKSITSKYY